MSSPITPDQCRAGRAILDMSQRELCEAAGVDPKTVVNFESGGHRLHPRTLAAITLALEAAGAVFIPAGDRMGPGVRLRVDRKRQAKRRVT
jgi:DNA-binding XRE family transcriptional regulator